MGGGGESAPNVIEKNPKLLQALENRSLLSSDPRVAELLTKYGTGGISLQEALDTASGAWGTKAQSARPTLDPKAQERWVEEQLGSRLQGQEKSAIERLYKMDPTLTRGQTAQRRYEQAQQVYRDELATAKQAGTDYSKLVDPRAALQAELEKERGNVTSQLQNEYANNFREQEKQWTADTRGNYDQFVNLLTTSPLAAQRYATDELKNNTLTSGLFGDKTDAKPQGGMQHQAEDLYSSSVGNVKSDTDQYQQLLDEIKSGEAYKLNEGDHTAYGQLSGNIARMFGSQEQSLAQSLADRGLGAAPSGAAGVGFSGLQGNKMEQLANAQRGVLQDRVKQANDAFQLRNSALGNKGQLDLGTLNSASSTAGQLGALGQSAISNLFNRNMEGRNAGEREIANAADRQLQNQQAVQNQINTQFNQEQATKGPSLLDVGLGLAGTVAGAAGGGFGSAIGGAAGSALGGALGLSSPKTTSIPGTGWGEVGTTGLTMPTLGQSYGTKHSDPELLKKKS